MAVGRQALPPDWLHLYYTEVKPVDGTDIGRIPFHTIPE